MDSSTLILICIAVALIAIAIVRRLEFVASFRSIAGPPSLPIFGNALQLNGSPSDFFRLLLEWHSKFGDTYQLWIGLRPFIAMANADHIQQILKSTVHIDKNLEYNLLLPFIGTGLVTSSGSKWHTRRKLLSPTFHQNILEGFLPLIEKQMKTLVKVLRKEVNNVNGFDIKPYAKLAALDTIGNTAMGCEINSQENSQLDYVKALDELTAIMQKRFITPWLKPNLLFNLTSLSKRQKACIDVIHTFTRKVIKERKDNFKLFNNQTSDANKNEIHYEKKPNRALLDLLIEVSEDGKVLSDEDIQEEVDTFMFAGVDTTSVTLSWVMYVLGKHPHVQDKIVEELNQKIPNFGDGNLTLNILSSLDYLGRTIKEVLRLYPSVPFIGRQIYQPLTIGDHTILPGTSIFINVFALHRNEKHFENPEKFDPDRFLKEKKNDRHRFAFVPFSAGSRNCIGQKFAMIVLKIAVATVIKTYRVKSIDPEEKLGLVGEIVLNALNGIHVTLEERT
ncbi:cytochrome P450 4C1 [Acyrthosiphon pisum]|uniref:Cytochrome P450 n=1 Tax=Acyrthosiphon pisum TaxID=7029 RepID=A0A8R1W5V8_ACYPI|nr:cytochrome P450 4C1 [Acyrthosiphon pisum]|eukprot:XP_001952110.2 PREDICTED: cytochrome P450 4C1 [Acyrthosiphon pisum]